MVVNKDLEKVLDSYNLLRSDFKDGSIGRLARELCVCSVIDHCLNNTESDVANISHRNSTTVSIWSCILLLILTLFEQLRPIHLQEINLLSDVVNLLVD